MTQRPIIRNVMTFNTTFQSSLMETNDKKFTIDKSLIQGIKENNISKIIDVNNEQSGIQDKKQLQDELKDIQGVVIDTRKRYDEVKTLTNRSEQQIDKLKKMKEILEQDHKKYQQIMQKQRTDLSLAIQQLQNMTQAMENSIFTKDIYNNLKTTLKKDIITLKKRYFDKDVQLMREKTKLKSIKIQHTNKITLSKRCREMLTTLQHTVNQKQMQRTSKIRSMHEVVLRKQSSQKNKQKRIKQMQEVRLAAMNDKVAQQKQWSKIMLTNKLLKSMLRSKMQGLMERYQEIQLSFHRIKQATCIKDSNQFINKYFAKEQSYGELLDAIAEKECKLEAVKEERETLEKDYQINLYRNQEICGEGRKYVDNSGDDNNENRKQSLIDAYKDKLLAIARHKQLMYSWSTKFLATYNGDNNRQKIINRYSNRNKKQQIKQLFIQALTILKQYMHSLNQEQVHIYHNILQDSPKKIQAIYRRTFSRSHTLPMQQNDRNTRVHTLSTNYEQDINLNNSFNNDPFEDQDMAYDDLSEMDYLQHNRRAVKKNQMMLCQSRRYRAKTKAN